MAGFKNDFYPVQTALTALMTRAETHNTIALSVTEVRCMLGIPMPNCTISLPVKVQWASDRLVTPTGHGVFDITFHDRYLTGYEPPGDVTPLGDRIDGWIERAYKLRYQLGLCREVLNVLHQDCSSPQQVRYLLPALQIICRSTSELSKLGEQISEFKAPRVMPSATAEFRAACREANMYITAASLYEDRGSWPGGALVALNTDFTFRAHGLMFR